MTQIIQYSALSGSAPKEIYLQQLGDQISGLKKAAKDKRLEELPG
jgi:hypothetical protein